MPWPAATGSSFSSTVRVRSPLWASMAPADREQFYRDTAASLPAGRVGEVDDIARAYLFCLTQPFATGSIVTVDGGAALA